MGKIAIPDHDWPGKIFANNWTVIKKISAKQGAEQYGLGSHNAHYLCQNKCGAMTFFDKTTLLSYFEKKVGEPLYKCRKCSGTFTEQCPYKELVRKQTGRDAVTANRTIKSKPGDVFGFFTVVKAIPSHDLPNHQSQSIVKCNFCGAERQCLNHHLYNFSVSCECFKNHSTGEGIVEHYLQEHNIPFKTEVVFDGLYGTGGGALRYDFGIYNTNNELLALIEYDGEQHFQEAGTYFNERGQVQIHDKIKNNYAQQHNIPLLRIPYFKAGNITNILTDFLATLQK